MRPGLCTEYGAPDENQRGAVEFLRFWRHQRHPGIRPGLSQTLTVTLRPSRVLALALTLMAGAALACTWISLPRFGFLPAATGIVLAWIWHLAPALQLGRRAVRALEVRAKSDARWQDGSGQWNEAEIQPGNYVSNWLVVVNLGAPGGRGRRLVLLPDCAAAEELRRLRVWLRWRCARP
ncbi:MAG: protein YgfX [Pseudomonadota bacterium]